MKQLETNYSLRRPRRYLLAIAITAASLGGGCKTGPTNRDRIEDAWFRSAIYLSEELPTRIFFPGEYAKTYGRFKIDRDESREQTREPRHSSKPSTD